MDTLCIFRNVQERFGNPIREQLCTGVPLEYEALPKDGEKTVYGFRDDMIDVDDYFVGVVAGDGDKGFSMALTLCMADLCLHISHQNLVPFS